MRLWSPFPVEERRGAQPEGTGAQMRPVPLCRAIVTTSIAALVLRIAIQLHLVHDDAHFALQCRRPDPVPRV
jgi:hypothetical protein